MICKQCKKCFNYKVSELGCFGNDYPCEYLQTDETNEMTITTEEIFKVTDIKTADYVFEKLSEIESRESELKAFSEEKILKVQQWIESELKPLESRKEYLKGLLLEYLMQEKEKDPKFKISTPSGKLNTRKTKTLKYNDEEMLNYLKVSHPDLIQVKETFSKNDVKKLIKDGVDVETGEIVSIVEEVENVNYIWKID